MTAFLLLLLTLGQCDSTGCPPRSPSILQSASSYTAMRDWGWHWATFEGRVIPLWGYHPDPWTLYFDPKLPENIVMINYSRATY